MKFTGTKIGLFLVILSFSACNVVKRVPTNRLLLTKNKVLINGESSNDEDVNSLIIQKHNRKLLGIPLRLHIYNTANPKSDSLLNHRLQQKLDKNGFWVNFLSKKQFVEWYNYKKAWHNWRRATGEKPTIINPKLSEISAEKLRNYFYYNKGYFNNKVHFDIDTLNKEKRGIVTYHIQLGKPYFTDIYEKEILNPQIDSLYQIAQKNTFFKPGDQFSSNTIDRERARLTSFFKNHGVYNFQESSIEFRVEKDTLTANNDQKMITTVVIGDLISRNQEQTTKIPYKIFKNGKIKIFADYRFDYNKDSLQMIHHDGFEIYYKNKLRYRPQALTDAVFMKKDSTYKDLERIRTIRQISNLETFTYPNIISVPDIEQGKLNTNIYLSARPRFSLENSFDLSRSNIQDYGITYRVGFLARNAFRGAETLEISARGTLGSSSSDQNVTDQTFFNVSEIGGDIKLKFPRILFPLNTDKIIPKYMFPLTTINSGVSLQRNIGLDKQTFNTVLKYQWNSSNKNSNVLELINVEFLKNLDPSDFFTVYNNTYNQLNSIAKSYLEQINTNYLDKNNNLTLNGSKDNIAGTEGFINEVTNNNITINNSDLKRFTSIVQRRDRLTQNNLIFSSSYAFTYNNKENIYDNSFSRFRAKFESSGNLLSFASNIFNFNQTKNGSKVIFDVPFSQYLKTELEYIKYWALPRNDVLAFRAFGGLAIPYGNSTSIPFNRSYFGGGSNDNRAWNAYSLGPGKSEFQLDFNEANLKLAFNLEYRFHMFGSVEGALFADAGNIWNVFGNSDIENSIFTGFDSLKDLALGTGFGLRYDFNYFVFRFDTGFKTYNPQLRGSTRWFSDYNFSSAVYQFGINYPF